MRTNAKSRVVLVLVLCSASVLSDVFLRSAPCSELPDATSSSSPPSGASKSSGNSKASSTAQTTSAKVSSSGSASAKTELVLTGDISGCKLTVCISNNDKVAGTPIASHHWWQTSENSRHFYHRLTPGVRQYLHVLVEPPSNSRVMLGVFEVGGGAKFASSGLPALDSRPQYWKVSRSGWGRDYQTPAVASGSSSYLDQCPVIKRLDPYAQTLMDPTGREGYNGYVFFSTTIEPSGGKSAGKRRKK